MHWTLLPHTEYYLESSRTTWKPIGRVRWYAIRRALASDAHCPKTSLMTLLTSQFIRRSTVFQPCPVPERWTRRWPTVCCVKLQHASNAGLASDAPTISVRLVSHDFSKTCLWCNGKTFHFHKSTEYEILNDSNIKSFISLIYPSYNWILGSSGWILVLMKRINGGA